MQINAMSFKAVFMSIITMASPFLPLSADHSTSYQINKLVADTAGVADNTDPNLLNPWGLIFDSFGNLVVANNHSDTATSYAQDGTPLSFLINVVTSPTGLERNHSHHSFIMSNGINSAHAQYLFATEAGTILGFNNTVDPNNAIIVIDRSAFNSVYKGLALAQDKHTGQHLLFATDFHNAKVDVFDSQFNLINSFTDPNIPAGFAPFNIRNFRGSLYVTYAKQNPPGNADDLAGPGNGFVDIFSTSGVLIKRLISQGDLNSPWGLALAPRNFGAFSHALLVGNFGDGLINAYNIITGDFLGQLSDVNGNPLVIPGLWSIKFSCHSSECHVDENAHHQHNKNATLFFTSGPNNENNGLVGSITPLHTSKHHHE